MIKVQAIKLFDEFEIYKNTNEEFIDFLQPVSKINIFVGSNNSGKSRFMRELSLQEDYEVKIQGLDLEHNNSIVSNAIEKIKSGFDDAGFTKINELSIEDLNNILDSLSDTLNLNYDKYGEIRNKFKRWKSYTKIQQWTSSFGHRPGDNFLKLIQEQSEKALFALNSIPVHIKANNPSKVYIPTLRGLRPLDTSHSDLYAERTKQDYYQETEFAPEIFTGLSLFKRLTDLLLGNNSERKLISDYQKFISQTLFEDKPVALIPNQQSKVVIVKIGNEKEQPIHHLGDGIQSAIILSFLPFVMQKQTFFFIEEPEMYLHPGLQRKILNFYNSLENHLFFMTTHSNHFLDITIDIKEASIFTFRKIFDDSDNDELTPNFTIEAVDSGHESSLELLGVRNSSVFLVNATIWVEGITDRWYFRKMLNSYMDYLEKSNKLDTRLEEDTHYSFVEYGGGNITHWSFLEDYEEHPIEVKRLCAKATVIVDKDGEKKTERKEALEKVLGERLIVLPCREVENLLPYKIIKDVVMEYEKNPKLAIKDYDYSQYQNVYLGRFIENTMLKKSFSRKGGYQSHSGTIKDKVKFCEKALDKIIYEELPESTKEVIQNIYNFIQSQNF